MPSTVHPTFHAAADAAQPGYFMRMAADPARAPVLVSVHGISRNAAEHALRQGAAAGRHAYTIVAPLFEADTWRGYQRLAAGAAGVRADAGMLALLDTLAGQGLPTERVHLFGFSGGAQFAHRFALLHPHRVATLSLAAAGWYTLPDRQLAWPLGLGDRPASLDDADLEAALQIPTLVLVGTADTGRDASVRQSHVVDRLQGLTRLERGQRWAAAMRAAARDRGLAPAVTFSVMHGGTHDFAQCARDCDMLDLAGALADWSKAA